MAVVNPLTNGIAQSVRGKIAVPNGLGNFVLGYSQLGEYNLYDGVYQQRFRNKAALGYEPDKETCKLQVRMKYSWPPASNTPAQDTNRTKFQDGMIAWGALTSEQQEAWNRAARKRYIRGSGWFMHKYMLDQDMNP